MERKEKDRENPQNRLVFASLNMFELELCQWISFGMYLNFQTEAQHSDVVAIWGQCLPPKTSFKPSAWGKTVQSPTLQVLQPRSPSWQNTSWTPDLGLWYKQTTVGWWSPSQPSKVGFWFQKSTFSESSWTSQKQDNSVGIGKQVIHFARFVSGSRTPKRRTAASCLKAPRWPNGRNHRGSFEDIFRHREVRPQSVFVCWWQTKYFVSLIPLYL